MSRYFIIAGETSGDYLGGKLAEAIYAGDRAATLAGWGGDQMRERGVTIFKDIAELQVMGWTDVLRQLPTWRSRLRECKNQITNFRPDKVVLIDFGSFNLRIAKWAKAQGYLVDYLSPPKVWASRERRLQDLQCCDQLLVLFPFEGEYFRQRGLRVTCVGHPLVEDLSKITTDPIFYDRYSLDDRPILAILPGSRAQEIIHCLPIYLSATKDLDHLQVCISASPRNHALVQEITADRYPIIQAKDYHQLLMHSDRAIVTSGTATLESAIMHIPQIVGYKTSWINYHIAKHLIQAPYISLPNLIAQKEVIPELIQGQCTPSNLQKTICLYDNPQTKSDLASAYKSIIFDIRYNQMLLTSSVTI